MATHTPSGKNAATGRVGASPLAYSTGQPSRTGVYACRVRIDYAPDLLEDIFLMWFEDRWWYCRSDQRYRGEVLGWLGPLPRTKAP